MGRQETELNQLDDQTARMGKDHAQWGGSARVALTRGTEHYKEAFAEQAYAQMQTSRLWTEQTKITLRGCLELGYYDAALEVIANANGEEGGG